MALDHGALEKLTIIPEQGPKIEALFNPLRGRVQDFIDQRFYRTKYDAEQMLASFADEARDEVDVHRLSSSLIRVAEESIQPETVSLWLRD